MTAEFSATETMAKLYADARAAHASGDKEAYAEAIARLLKARKDRGLSLAAETDIELASQVVRCNQYVTCPNERLPDHGHACRRPLGHAGEHARNACNRLSRWDKPMLTDPPEVRRGRLPGQDVG